MQVGNHARRLEQPVAYRVGGLLCSSTQQTVDETVLLVASTVIVDRFIERRVCMFTHAARRAAAPLCKVILHAIQ
jgi:hypothetical protein